MGLGSGQGSREALGAGEILLNCIDTNGQCAAWPSLGTLVQGSGLSLGSCWLLVSFRLRCLECHHRTMTSTCLSHVT